jgi:hypothetical protein
VAQARDHSTERLKHRSSILPGPFYRLALERADILVTHEASSTHRYGWQAIDDLARALGVQELYHGHQHDCLDYSAHGNGWSSGVTALDRHVGRQGIRLNPGHLRHLNRWLRVR